MSTLKVTDSFSFSETRLELAPSSLKFFQENFLVTFSSASPDCLCQFSFKRLSKMYHTIYANTHFDTMDFEVEELIQKMKISLKNQTSCFGQIKKNHFKKSQTYLPTNNHFIAKVTYKGYVRYISFLFLTSKKSSLFETEKMLSILFQSLFQFLRYSNLRILESQTSRPPQIPNMKQEMNFTE